MAKIRIVHRGQNILETELAAGREYIAGRGSQSDIPLPHEKGVSRQHLRFFNVEGTWVVEQISKYGAVVYNSESLSKLELRGQMAFSVPPFDFLFDDFEAAAQEQQQQVQQQTHLTKTNPVETSNSLDATRVMSARLTPFLIIKNLKTRTEDVLKLGDGTNWTAGRHPDCPIQIKDSAMSRSQFHITFEKKTFFVTDHGSSNGTKLNGEKLEPQTATPLHSGDVLKVRHVEILFELRDPNFQKQLALVPTASTPDYLSNSDYHIPAEVDESAAAQVLRIPPQSLRTHPIIAMVFANRIRAAIAGVVVVILLSLIFGGDPPPTDNQSNNGSTQPGGNSPNTAISLSEEQTRELRDTLALAKRHYGTQKWELCLEQIERIRQVTPFFEDSKSTETLCLQGREIAMINQERARIDQKRQETENMIQTAVTNCSANIKSTTTLAEAESCLQEVIPLDPQHPAITDLLARVESQESRAKSQQDMLVRIAMRKKEGQKVYNDAERAFQNQEWKQSLRLFKQFRAGSYPGLNPEADNAVRRIATIESTISQEISQKLSACEAQLQSGNLKLAYVSCQRVLKENPNNTQAVMLKKKVSNQMDREMKALFEDSVLEESLGNVESAKEKWIQITDKAVPENDYFKKARNKLKKYGIEI